MAELNFGAKNLTTLKSMRMVLNFLIDRQFLADFTWTGKTKKIGSRKHALREFNGVVDLIYEIVAHWHPNYMRTDFHKDLVDKVLKFAYE